VELLITTTDDSPTAEQLRGLWMWLADRHDPYLVDGVSRAPEAGKLNNVVDALSVSLASGGTTSVLVSGIVEWIRNGHQKNVPLVITLKCADGAELIIDTQIVQAWSPAELIEQVVRLVALLRNDKPER
jgi:hypothetical protein